MHYQLHSCTQDWQMMWVELKIISHWPLRFLAFPPLPASPHVWCCFIRWLRTGLLARQLKLAVGICNWLFVSLIPQKRVDCMEKEQRRARVLHTVLECNKWAPSFLLAGKIATATIMQRPHTKCLSHTHIHTAARWPVACECVFSSSIQTMTVNLCSAICCIARHLTGAQQFQAADFCRFQNTLQSRTNILYIECAACARVS